MSSRMTRKKKEEKKQIDRSNVSLKIATGRSRRVRNRVDKTKTQPFHTDAREVRSRNNYR